MKKLSQADQILIVAGGLYFIDSFLPWNRACVKFGAINACGSANLWHNVGILAALLAIAVLALTVMSAIGSTPIANSGMIVGGMAVGILVFSILKIIIDNDFLSFGAWIGLVLSVVIAYGGYLKYKAPAASGEAPPSPGYTGGTPPTAP
jgi:drug/metabolite transporter (DMT)-like permease